MTGKKLSVGDPVEVLFYRRTGISTSQKWRPATLQSVRADRVTAVFADGTRLDIPRDGRGRFRRIR